MKWQIVSRNVASAVELPKVRRPPIRPLDAEGAARFLDVAKRHREHQIFALGLYTGLRRGELLGLRWEDVDLERGFIHVRQNLVQLNRESMFAEPKTPRSRRQVALSPNAVAILKAAKRRQAEDRLKAGSAYEDSGLVSTKPSGTKHDPTTVSHKFAVIAREAGFPGLRMHDLRHTHATLLLAQGAHPKIIQERLGHASIAMTMDVYSHVLPGLQEAAAAKLDEILGHQSGTKTKGRPS